MIPIEQSEGDIGGKFIQFPGPVITWVGEMPWLNGFAYGDEEGGLRFTSIDGRPAGTFKVIESDRSINHVAFSELDGFRYVAACTASDIAIHRFTEGGELLISKVYGWGGHGIYATRRGGFLVPMGPVGLAVLIPHPDGTIEEAVFNESKNMHYHYSMSLIASSDKGKELWVCAGRSDGLIAITLDDNRIQQPPRVLKSALKRQDYVGACSIGTMQMPRATVSLSPNGEVNFFIDLLEDKTPLTWHFNHGQGVGVAYSLAAAGGHLFILTSKGIYICRNIVERFLRGELRVGVETITVRYLPLEVIDCALVYNTWMMVLLHDKIVRLTIDDMVRIDRSVVTGQSVERATPVEALGSEPIWADITLPSAVGQLQVA